MQKKLLSLFVNYNKTANNTMDGIIKTLSKEEWEKPLGGYFPSVRSICSHLYLCDFNWLKRFKNVRSFTTLDNPFFDRDNYPYSVTLFEDMEEYLGKRPDMDSRMISFVDELTDADLDKVLKYTDPKGRNFERNFGGCVLHFMNHDTHHRGMLSLYLEMLGRENDFNSLVQIL